MLKPEPLVAAIEYAKSHLADGRTAKVFLPSPRGHQYKQSDAKRLAAADEDLIIICPRYEGYDATNIV